MGGRRAGRERALQALYQLDMLAGVAEEGDKILLWEQDDDEATAFARTLVEGVSAERARIDRLIAESLEHWDPSRLSRVDVNVLRIGACELLRHPEVPTAVVIDEAVEIARRYGGAESSAFVNGVLDRIAELLGAKGDVPGRTSEG